jgi:hypothetical protein
MDKQNVQNSRKRNASFFQKGRFPNKVTSLILSVVMVFTMSCQPGFADTASAGTPATNTNAASSSSTATQDAADQTAQSASADASAAEQSSDAAATSSDSTSSTDADTSANANNEVTLLSSAQSTEAEQSLTTESSDGVEITSIDADGVSAGGTLGLSDTSTFNVTIKVAGNDQLAGRTVTIDVPDGLQIVSGLGFTGVSNGSITTKDLTSVEKIEWAGSPTYTANAAKSLDSYSGTWNSGKLVYTLNNGIGSGTINLVLRADGKAWDYTNTQSLSPLKVSMANTTDTSTDEKKCQCQSRCNYSYSARCFLNCSESACVGIWRILYIQHTAKQSIRKRSDYFRSFLYRDSPDWFGIYA